MNSANFDDVKQEIAISRRALVASGLASIGWALTGGVALAQSGERLVTPRLPAGPNYPYDPGPEPIGNMVVGPMKGDSTPFTLGGEVLDRSGAPIVGARAELWQCDGLGMYHHANHSSPSERDAGFVAYGWQRADDQGRFAFRTIKIIPCENRCPHFHVAVSAPGRRQLITQIFLPDHPLNARDVIYRRLSQQEQAAVTAKLQPTAQGEAGLISIVLA
jgi:protocatechuate 3,4-dioxygenase, beta subunit